MANEASGFFNAEYDADSDYWDRVYTADQFADYFAKLVSNGVFEGGLQVKQHSDTSTAMDVRVVTGKAMINGYWYSLNEETYFNVDVNASSSVRVDCVCLQYNFSNRTINVVYHKNTSQPVRNGEMYELMIATINVGSGATSISQSAITDTRSSTSVCGIVTGLIDQIDFDEAYAQFTTWFNEYKESIIEDFSDAGEMAQAIFDAWFEHMKGQLSTDAAGHLQLELDSQAEMIADNYSPAKLYSVGECVTYENKLYRCKSATTSYGEFNPAKWDIVQVDKPEKWIDVVLSVGGWNEGVYSFESIYPSSKYDILDIVLDEDATAEMRKAWSKADCGGYYSTNQIIAHKTVPMIDLNMKMCVRAR